RGRRRAPGATPAGARAFSMARTAAARSRLCVRAASATDGRAGNAPRSSLLSTNPQESTSIASAATRMVGSFLGHDGVLETVAAETTRASRATAPTLARALASRYLAR